MALDPDIRPFTGIVTRLTDGPLIAETLFGRSEIAGLEAGALANINGPSLLRMPDWTPERRSAYHLYVAHHKGKSIRLAHADDLAGPWRMHPDPVLHVADSRFETEDPVYDASLPAPEWAAGPKGDYLYAHVALPDVHVDADNHRLITYFHGLLANGDQRTRIAFSDVGLSFAAQEPLIGPPYIRAMRLEGWIYLAMWGGQLAWARDWTGPFDFAPPEILAPWLKGGAGRQVRHGRLFAPDGRLQMTGSRISDAPELLIHCEIVPADD